MLSLVLFLEQGVTVLYIGNKVRGAGKLELQSSGNKLLQLGATKSVPLRLSANLPDKTKNTKLASTLG